jgi:ATP-dependent RNA helicase DDX49/DBP8
MAGIEEVEGLSEVIGRAIQEHLERSNINVRWPQIDNLVRPILRIEAFLEDAGPGSVSSPRSERVASVSAHPSLSASSICVNGRTYRKL